MPATDVNGKSAFFPSRYLLVTLACSGCSLASGIESVLGKAAIRPVVVVVSEKKASIPRALLDSGSARIIVVSDRSADYVPLPMLNEAPQAALVVDGKIVAVPAKSQTLSQFIARGSS